MYYERFTDEEGNDNGAEYYYVTAGSCIPVRRVYYETRGSHGQLTDLYL